MAKRAAGKIARLSRHRIQRGSPFPVYNFFFKIRISFKINCSDDVLIKGESFQMLTSVLQEKPTAVLMLCATILRDRTTVHANTDTMEMEISAVWVTIVLLYFLSRFCLFRLLQ